MTTNYIIAVNGKACQGAETLDEAFAKLQYKLICGGVDEEKMELYERPANPADKPIKMELDWDAIRKIKTY